MTEGMKPKYNNIEYKVMNIKTKIQRPSMIYDHCYEYHSNLYYEIRTLGLYSELILILWVLQNLKLHSLLASYYYVPSTNLSI